MIPEKPEEKALKELQTVIAEHLSPVPIIIAGRYMFYNRKQLAGGKVAVFMKELRRLASSYASHANCRCLAKNASDWAEKIRIRSVNCWGEKI